MITADELREKFESVFGRGPRPRIVRAPGRVNLIGEHTDYNGGFVMPMAIPESIWIAFRPRDDNVVHLNSEQFNEEGSFTLGEGVPADIHSWLAYPAQVGEVLTEMLKARDAALRGAEGLVYGEVPIGSGLSSSAAIEVASALMFLLCIYDGPQEKPSVKALCEAHGLTTREVALVCQEAEHRVGVNCGIMDQFTALHARQGYVMMLDCRSLEYRDVPLPAGNIRAVIIDTGKRRQLADAAYNERRQECAEGVEILKKFDKKIQLLRDVSPEFFAAHADDLPEPIRRRCRHIITENERVLASAEALETGDIAGFGRLMNESHESLRDDYEVSCRELDLLVEIARSCPGVFGSRMTGGGFGGCTVTLVFPDAAEDLEKAVLSIYKKETGLEPKIYLCEPAAGASVEI